MSPPTVVPTAAEVATRIDGLIERGLEKYAAGDLLGALCEWEHALALDPGSRAQEHVTFVRQNFDLLDEQFRLVRDQAEKAARNNFAMGTQADRSTGGVAGFAASERVDSSLDEGWELDDFIRRSTAAARSRAAEAAAAEPPPDVVKKVSRGKKSLRSALDEALDMGDGIEFATPSHRPATPPPIPVDANIEDDDEPLAGVDPTATMKDMDPREFDVMPVSIATASSPLPDPESVVSVDGSLEMSEEELPSGDEDGDAVPEPVARSREVSGEHEVRFPRPDTGDFEAAATAARGSEPTAPSGDEASRSVPSVLVDEDLFEEAQISMGGDRQVPRLPSANPDIPSESRDGDRIRQRVMSLLAIAREAAERGDRLGATQAAEMALDEDPEGGSAGTELDRHRELLYRIFEAHLGPMEQVPNVAVPVHEIVAARLDHRTGFLLSRIDGTLTYEDILDVAGMPRLEAYRLLTNLLRRGFIEVR